MKGKKGRREERIRRFSAYRVAEHWGIILTTMILFATGLCQRFWHLDLSQGFILKMGGVDNVRLLHRYAGLVFSLEIFLNVTVGVGGIAELPEGASSQQVDTMPSDQHSAIAAAVGLAVALAFVSFVGLYVHRRLR